MKSIQILFFIMGFIPATYGMSSSVGTKCAHKDTVVSQEELEELNYQLVYAAADGFLEKIQQLISQGADIDAQNFYGERPLHLAVENGHISCLKELISKGANIDVKDQDGNRPLHIAAQHGHISCLKELIAKGANIEAKGEEGTRPLHLAAFYGFVDCLKEFLKNDVQINCQTDEGETPLDLARRGEANEICIQLLLDHCAKSRKKLLKKTRKIKKTRKKLLKNDEKK